MQSDRRQFGRVAAARNRDSSSLSTLPTVRGRCIERWNGTENRQSAERRPSLFRGGDRYGSDADGIVEGEPHASRARPPRRWRSLRRSVLGRLRIWVPRLFRTRHFRRRGTFGFVFVRKWPRVRDGTARPARMEALHEGRTARPREPLEPGVAAGFPGGAQLPCTTGRARTSARIAPAPTENTAEGIRRACRLPVPVSGRSTDASSLASESSRAAAFRGMVSTSGELRRATRRGAGTIPSRFASIPAESAHEGSSLKICASTRPSAADRRVECGLRSPTTGAQFVPRWLMTSGGTAGGTRSVVFVKFQ